MDRADIEKDRGLLEVDGREGRFPGGLEGVVPGEGEVGVGAVGGDGEARLDEGEGAVVGEEEGEAGREGGVGGFLDGGSHLADGLEIVLGHLGLALGEVGGDVVAEGAVDVGGGGFLLVDGEHGVGGGR